MKIEDVYKIYAILVLKPNIIDFDMKIYNLIEDSLIIFSINQCTSFSNL